MIIEILKLSNRLWKCSGEKCFLMFPVSRAPGQHAMKITDHVKNAHSGIVQCKRGMAIRYRYENFLYPFRWKIYSLKVLHSYTISVVPFPNKQPMVITVLDN